MTEGRVIRVGSRASRLAVVQSEIIMTALASSCPGLRTELVTMTTTGDKRLDVTLDKIGGKGLFVKELDEALRQGEVDITVHSMKDLPAVIPDDLPLVGTSVREDPRDVLVLPEGRIEMDTSFPVGTSSLRRSLQLRCLYPDMETEPVRGNVETRLRKLDEGQYSALIMAAAGLKRLGLGHRISRYFEIDEIIPAPCQGILAIQSRKDMDRSLLSGVTDEGSMLCAAAERAFVRAVGADCGSPDTAHAYIDGGMMHITGLRYDAGNGRMIREELSGSAYAAEELGRKLAERLLGK